MSLFIELSDYLNSVNVIPKWDTLRTDRTRDILPKILDATKGSILEIGAHRGTTTAVFCNHAKDFGRQVFVVDPWDGRQQGNNEVGEEFGHNTAGFDNLTVINMGSEDPRVIDQLQGQKFAFILIDGLHTYDAVRNDIATYAPLLVSGGILCIDDWTGPYGFSARIRQATNEHLPKSYTKIDTPLEFIEAYFIKD